LRFEALPCFAIIRIARRSPSLPATGPQFSPGVTPLVERLSMVIAVAYQIDMNMR
jgi:hypothetical protein